SREGAHIIARQDRIPAWSFPYLFIAIIGVGFLFTFYDIFDINVSFIQTCTQIVPGCTPLNAASYLGLRVLLNLIAYVIDHLFLLDCLSPLRDRISREWVGASCTALVPCLRLSACCCATSYRSLRVGSSRRGALLKPIALSRRWRHRQLLV